MRKRWVTTTGPSSLPRATRRCAAIALAALVVLGPSLSSGASQIPPAVSTAVPPPGASPNPKAAYSAVSCTGANACVGVGSFLTSTGHVHPAFAATVNGTSYQGVDAVLPPDARANPSATLRAVSCARPGQCLAVGSYVTASGRNTGLVAAWLHGAAAAAASPPVPHSAAANPREALDAVSCLSPAACEAAGSFVTSTGSTQGVLDRTAGGTWLAPSVLATPTGHRTDPLTAPAAAACWAPGSCAVVGTYVTTTNATEGFVVLTAGGAPQAPTELTMPPAAAPNPAVTLDGVSCPTRGACVVVGTFRTVTHETVPVAFQQRPAGWQATTLALPPGHRGLGQIATMGEVSCSSPWMCLAVGSFLSVSGARLGAVDELVSRTWQPAVGIAAPAGTQSTRLALLGSSCGSSRQCTVVGQVTEPGGSTFGVSGAAYLPPSAPNSVRAVQGPGRTAMVSWGAAGIPGSGISGYRVWRQLGTGAPVLLGESSSTTFIDRTGIAYGERYVYLVSTYADDRQSSPTVSVALTTYGPASPPRSVRATPGHQSIAVRWQAPLSDGGSAVAQYQLDLSWHGGTETVTVPGSARSTTVGGLVTGTQVTVRVAAVTAAGTGSLSTPITVVPT